MVEASARKRIWGWWFFDWATQPYHTLLVTFIFGPYFASVAAQTYLAAGLEKEAADAAAQTLWAWGWTIIGLIIAFSAPFIGALADLSGKRLPWIIRFSVMYATGSAALWFMMPDGSYLMSMLVAFGIGFIGAEFALIFINAQLPDLGTDEEIGKISGSGFAFGYFGGLVSLAIMLCFFAEQGNGKTLIGMDPLFGLDAGQREGTRFVGPFTAIWFAVFMIPYFLWMREEPRRPKPGGPLAAWELVKKTIVSLPGKPSLFAYLGSSMFYRDALNGLYSFGGIYAGLVLEWDIVKIGIFGIVALIGSAVFSWIGGRLDRRLGPRPVIIGAIWILILVCSTIVSMDKTQIFFFVELDDGSSVPDIVFFTCGVFIGGMGGILQSASRSLMVRHSDPEAPTESFGLYGLSGKATAFLAPFLIALTTDLTDSARLGVSPIIFLFIVGLILLRWVRPEGEQGRWDESSH